MKNINSQVLRKTFAFSLVRFILVRLVLARFVLAAILIPALLIGSAFTFGGSNLQAQAVQNNTKSGFFAGFVYLSGFKVDTTKLVTTNSTTITDSITTGYRITGYGDATSSIVATSGRSDWDAATATGARTLVSANCKDGKTTTVNLVNVSYSFEARIFDSFDSGAKPSTIDSVTTRDPSNDRFLSGLSEGETSHCYSYFFGDLSSDRSSIPNYQIATPDSAPTPTSVHADPRTTTSSKSDKLSGIGLQFGFRWEKWRASLTHYTGKGGANELANTLVMADYFVNKGLFVGGGLASMTLQNSLTSGSATSPVLRVGYKQNLTSNLSLNFGLKKYISGVSLKSSVTTTTTPTTTNTTPIVLRSFEKTQTARGDSATIGIRNVSIDSDTIDLRFLNNVDNRIEVTQFHSRTVNIDEIQIPAGATETQTETTTETDAELKAPLVISISFHLTF